MVRDLVRDMNERERAFLSEACSDPFPSSTRATELWRGLGLCLVALSCPALLVLVLLWNPALVVTTVASVLLCLTFIVAFFIGGNMLSGYFRWKKYGKSFKNETTPKIKDALTDGRVEVKQVEATSVIEILEFEDEGQGYIFDIGEGKSLLLKGQHYYPADDRAAWPNSRFELARTVRHRLWVGIYCYGRHLVPSRTIESQECKEDFIWSEREEIVDSPPNEALKTLLLK